MNWVKLFDNEINLNIQTKILPTKGNLVYEYNPLRNYRLSSNKYEYDGNLYSLGELFDKFKITIDISNKTIYRQLLNNIYNYYTENPTNNSSEIDYTSDSETFGQWISSAYLNRKYAEIINIEKFLNNKDLFNDWYGVPATKSDPVLREKGELVDFITDELKVDLTHPLQIIPQYSYDGSVNLIINDGINIPKLINTRFSATGKNTYEIVDRKGNNDSNIYDSGDQFEVDTSLYKRITKIPKIKFEGVTPGGNLKIGNYHFYFKLADDDGNETDFFGESGLVSVFIGSSSYSSVNTGQKNQNSYKQVIFDISNLDSAYSYINVYYSRSTAEGLNNSVTEYIKIDKKYLIQSQSTCKVVVTGFEEIIPVTISDINLLYNTVDAAKASAVCQNMLFLGNVHKPNIPYKELQDLSLRFLPYLKEEIYNQDIDHNYRFNNNQQGYIDPKFIYEKTGYWGEELYRLGIVYILPNNELTPVFNIRGAIGIKSNSEFSYSEHKLYDEDGKRNYITYSEETNYITGENIAKYENVKGVISLNPDIDTDIINSLDIRVDDETINELKKYIKGYFFVRQPRIPTILAQGITIGIDKTARTPTLPVKGNILNKDEEELTNTILTLDDLNGVNYVSEGFLSRYKFKFKEKENTLKVTGKAALVGLGIIAVAASAVFTAGVSLGILAGIAAGTGVAVGLIGATEGIAHGININTAKLTLNGVNTTVPKGYELVETNDSKKLDGSYYDRLIIKNPKENMIQGIICPDYSINQPYYNQIFTGSEHLIKTTKSQNINSNRFNMEDRHFYIPSYKDQNLIKQGNFAIIGIPENVKAIGLSDYIFRSRAGEAEEAWRFETIGENIEVNQDLNLEKNNTDIIRGIYGSYLAFDDKNNLFDATETVNIYIPNYQPSQLENYINIRMNDTSSYHAISDRISIQNIDEYLVNKGIQIGTNLDRSEGYTFNIYRGDCYICQFTQRMLRNFNDPSAPYNDDIVDANSWKDNYDPSNSEKYANINLGDVNAVELGMWVTFKVRSSNNLNIRTLDGSDVSEVAASGHEKGYYPYHPMSTEGSYKISDSQVYNKGFAKSLSERINVQVPDVPHIKNWFGTRIMYSDIHINDSFKNGFRVFQGTNYRDYTREYGEITKLVPFESSLLVVFEHGIALLPVNERAVAGQGAGGNVYINTSNVLPENPKIISDTFGSQWPESVLKVPGKTGDAAQYVYGVDTVAKKIWRTDGNTLQCISDMRVQEFLNNNITLGERELTPKIGIRNVKTVYNAFKRDVLFTFYDNTYGFEEKVWNLCWNELLGKFITFYSWVPSYMENINNIPFSLNRDTSKWIAKLGTSHTESSIADGITLSNVLTNNETKQEDNKYIAVDNFNFTFTYIDKEGNEKTKIYTVDESSRHNYIGVLSLSNRTLPNNKLFYQIEYILERDSYLNFKSFEIVPIKVKDEKGSYNYDTEKLDENGNRIIKTYDNCIELPDDALYAGKSVLTYALKFKDVEGNNSNAFFGVETLLTELYYRNSAGNAYADYDHNKIGPGIAKTEKVYYDLPIFKDITGKRKMLPKDEQLNPDKIVTLLNIKANIKILDEINTNNSSDNYYNLKAGLASGTSLIDAGYYKSVVAIAPKWNLQFLSSDFWKHGQGGLIDIADDIYPTYWYGKTHPFEFECVVVNDPSVHKIFTNLELVANKAKPESFHYEIIGETYDFAKDKPNMYFRQEAKKALWQYNGSDISYNRNFLKTQPIQQAKSADFPHKYYYRKDGINEIEDYYHSINLTSDRYSYKHLSGAEIVYYPNRQEYRIWQHAPAVNLDDLSQDTGRSIISANCQYLEDRWKITINPIIVCYKNEGKLWKGESSWTSPNRPPLTIKNSPVPNDALEEINENNGRVMIPDELWDLGYTADDMDTTNWLDDINIYKTSFGEAQNRKEVDVRDKFMKVRIRYSGEELAVIDFLNTIYRVSYA